MTDLNVLMGRPVLFLETVPRPGVVVIDSGVLAYLPSGAILCHPDEEPHLWMLVGEVSRAFLALRRILNRDIRQAAHEATKRVDAHADELSRPGRLLVKELLRDLERL